MTRRGKNRVPFDVQLWRPSSPAVSPADTCRPSTSHPILAAIRSDHARICVCRSATNWVARTTAISVGFTTDRGQRASERARPPVRGRSDRRLSICQSPQPPSITTRLPRQRRRRRRRRITWRHPSTSFLAAPRSIHQS